MFHVDEMAGCGDRRLTHFFKDTEDIFLSGQKSKLEGLTRYVFGEA